MMAKIFLTGGTGFIGIHVVEKLKKKYDLAILTRQSNLEREFEGVQIIQGNLLNKKKIKNILKEFNPNILIHLAWGGILERNYGLEQSIINFKGGLNLLESLAETDCKKIIFVGSDQEYGIRQGELNENMPSSSINPFTTAKNCLNDFGKEIGKEIGANFYWPRIFYVYGPGQKKGLSHILIQNIKEGKTIEIKDPLTKHDFVYIDDIANALVGLVDENAKKGIYNIGSGYSTSVKEIVDTTHRLMGVKYNWAEISQKEFSDRWADISKIKKEIGWIPKVSLEEGIKRTIKSYNKNIISS